MPKGHPDGRHSLLKIFVKMAENGITTDLKDSKQVVDKDREPNRAASCSSEVYRRRLGPKNYVKCSQSLATWQTVLFQLMTVGQTEVLAL